MIAQLLTRKAQSKAKNGTCSFYAYATLYVIKKNKRVTLLKQMLEFLRQAVDRNYGVACSRLLAISLISVGCWG